MAEKNTRRAMARRAFFSAIELPSLKAWLCWRERARASRFIGAAFSYTPIGYTIPTMAHIQRDRKKLLARVRRIAGQVAALEQALGAEVLLQMLEDGRYRRDVY